MLEHKSIEWLAGCVEMIFENSEIWLVWFIFERMVLLFQWPKHISFIRMSTIDSDVIVYACRWLKSRSFVEFLINFSTIYLFMVKYKWNKWMVKWNRLLELQFIFSGRCENEWYKMHISTLSFHWKYQKLQWLKEPINSLYCKNEH